MLAGCLKYKKNTEGKKQRVVKTLWFVVVKNQYILRSKKPMEYQVTERNI